jgi:RimJ/RimL family protein N-acetyltransferase
MQLSVYIDNHRARRCYERYGFVGVGRYRFMVGAHADEDVVMRRNITDSQ